MMDAGTGLALLGSAKILEKLLGPTADYIGEGVKNWAQKRTYNVKNIFSIAITKLGNKIENEGTISPKVLKGVLDEGSFCDDPLSSEYFGGVLASSRTGISRDDRGVTFIKLISGLSTYQIRSHYIFYHVIKRLFDGTSINFGTSEGRSQMKVYVPFNIFVEAMDFDEKENINVLIGHIMFGLQKEKLIEDFFLYGSKEYIEKHFNKATTSGIIFQPSSLGIELFFWAYGKADLTNNDFFKPENKFEINNKINIKMGYMKTKE
ncbi:MAG: hypothetical protein ABH873_08355 [Candidatus Firestonebacteria bacterium]